MSKIRTIVTTSVMAGIASLAVAVGMGAEHANQYRADARTYVIPSTQIISFNDTVGRLDTGTGAVYQLRGNVNAPSSAKTWELRVPAVTGDTSGVLEIQRATFNNPEATFLVDVVTGRTWILNRRSNDNGSWDEVKIYR